MRMYGLTGGIASGKSEVARRLIERGVPVINSDRIGHTLLEPGSEVADAVVNAFGRGIVSCGRIDKERLAGIVFADAQARQKLNAIMHPVIKGIIAERCAALAAEGHNAVVVEAAIMAEGGKLEEWLDGLILVTCPREMRLSRLTEHRGMGPEEARCRIEAQTLPEGKTPLADWIIENDGTLEELHARTDEIAEEILSDAA